MNPGSRSPCADSAAGYPIVEKGQNIERVDIAVAIPVRAWVAGGPQIQKGKKILRIDKTVVVDIYEALAAAVIKHNQSRWMIGHQNGCIRDDDALGVVECP